MKSNRTLTQKEAVAIRGSLSEPNKMPGHAYSLPAAGPDLPHRQPSAADI